MTKQLCRDCKHLETDGMFGIFCGVGGDNTKYDCPKYEKEVRRIIEKRFTLLDETIIDNEKVADDGGKEIYWTVEYVQRVKLVELLNELHEENQKLTKVIEEDEKLIQSTYDELTKLRCIKKNLGRIKAQWDWIMEAIQYD